MALRSVKGNHLEVTEAYFQHGWSYAELLEHIDVGILVFDLLNEKIIAQNRAALALFKNAIRPKDFRAFYNLFFHDWDGNINEMGLPPKAKRLTYGSRFFGYTIHPMEGGYSGLFVHDITHKSRIKALTDAVDFVDYIDNIFFGIRQEFGNPICRIKNTLKTLRTNIEDIPSKKARVLIDDAFSDLNKMDLMLSALKEFGNYTVVDLQPIDILAFYGKYLAVLNRSLQRKKIKLISINSLESAMVQIDPNQLKKALYNVISNAIDALKDSKEPTITITLFKNKDIVHLQIEDNGSGIPQYLQERVFHPFYSAKIGAMGLGLTITKKILSKFNSTVRLTGFQDVGTMVEILIPEIIV